MSLYTKHLPLRGVLLMLTLLLASWAQAEDCVVGSNATTGAGSLTAAIEKATRGDCRVALAAGLRKRYEAFVPVSPMVHLIRIPKSATITIGNVLPVLHAVGGETLILVADKSATITLSGQAYSATEPPIQISGEDGNVILDGIGLQGFPLTAIEMAGRDNLLMAVAISGSGSVAAPALRILGGHNVVALGTFHHNVGDAVLVDDALGISTCGIAPQGTLTRLVQNTIANNAGAGIRVHAPQVIAIDNDIHHNKGVGVTVSSVPGNTGCAEAKAVLYTAELRKNQIHDNADGVVISENGLVPPVDLVAVNTPTASEYHLIGNIGRSPKAGYPWDDAHLNLKAAIVDIFLGDSAKGRQGLVYLTSVSVLDVPSRLFSVHIPKPIVVEGKEIPYPIFVATLTDPEHHNTSRFSDPLNLGPLVFDPLDGEAKRDWDYDGIPNDKDEDATLDWDHDGIPNYKEDLNQDGIVTLESGETDPRLSDTDGDGLTDGEERHHTGRVAEAKITIKDLSRLNPTRSDSDYDCLPDGLELGVAAFEWPHSVQAEYSVLTSPSPKLTEGCLELLKSHGLYQVDVNAPDKNTLLIKNSLLRDPVRPATLGNVIGIYDLDPTSLTDPTNKDTDSDGLMDGAEDWNWDGARNKKDSAWLEADPMLKDSDVDGLQDGDEDKNGNGLVDTEETSPLLADTDRDGVSDALEVRQGGNPTRCDSDGDGLPDGIENNLANTDAPEGCPGTSAGGTNFAIPAVLNSSKVDSDGDGLKDGDEDKNHNGWLDSDESDPTTSDTDGDGLTDDVEVTGDVDHDGAPDFFVGDINNGAKCNPPTSIADVDCDGLSNAQDTDSDNDGCPDRAEGLDSGNNAHAIPAAYNRETKQCGSSGNGGGAGASSGSGGGIAAAGAASPVASESADANAFWAGRTDGGGDCSLLPASHTGTPPVSLFFLAALMSCVLVTARAFLRPKS